MSHWLPISHVCMLYWALWAFLFKLAGRDVAVGTIAVSASCGAACVIAIASGYSAIRSSSIPEAPVSSWRFWLACSVAWRRLLLPRRQPGQRDQDRHADLDLPGHDDDSRCSVPETATLAAKVRRNAPGHRESMPAGKVTFTRTP